MISNAVVNVFCWTGRGSSLATRLPEESNAFSVPFSESNCEPAKSFTRACGLVNRMTSGTIAAGGQLGQGIAQRVLLLSRASSRARITASDSSVVTANSVCPSNASRMFS